MTAYVNVSEAKTDRSIVRFGATLMKDPTAVYRVYLLEAIPPATPEAQPTAKGTLLFERKLPPKGIVKLKLTERALYVVVAWGTKTAAAIATDKHVLRAPFVVKIDANTAEAQRRETGKPVLRPITAMHHVVRGLMRGAK